MEDAAVRVEGDHALLDSGPGAVVEGPMTFERAVRLYVSDTATIGQVTGAAAIKFAGDQAPN